MIAGRMSPPRPPISAAPIGTPAPSALPSDTGPAAGRAHAVERTPGSPRPHCTSSAISSAPVGAGLRIALAIAAGRPHAAFALDRLDDDRGGLVIDASAAVASSAGDESRRHQRPERRPIVLVPGHRQRAHRRPWNEWSNATNRSRAAPARASSAARTSGTPRGFGAAVAEERARQARERRQPARDRLQRMKEQVRRVQQLAACSAIARGERRVRVAERSDADAGNRGPDTLAPRVEQTRSRAATNTTGARR